MLQAIKKHSIMYMDFKTIIRRHFTCGVCPITGVDWNNFFLGYSLLECRMGVWVAGKNR